MDRIFPLSGKPIVVIGPMACEIEYIASKLDSPREVNFGGYHFTVGTVDDYPVIAARSLIGMVNSAVTTALAIREFDPAMIIIQGTAGGHDPERHKNDMILGERLVELGNFYTPHRDEGRRTRIEDWYTPGEEIMTDEGIRRFTTLFSDEELLEAAEETPYNAGKLVRGTIGSADLWNKEIDRIDYLHRIFESDAEEMEGFAVAQVCMEFGVPMIDIRIVSNSELYPEEVFSEDAGVICQEYVYRVIRHMIEKK